MRKRNQKRLTPEQATFLNIEVKIKKNNDGFPKYTLTTEQAKKLEQYKQEPNEIFQRLADEAGADISEIKHGWLKTEGASFFFTNPLYKSAERNQFAEELMEYVSNHSPKYSTIKRENTNDEGHLLIVNPADIHMGKLAMAMETGDDYNQQIATQRVKEGVAGIIEKSKGFHIEKIIFVGGNDILHVDTPRRTTTSGTPQDTDSNWYDNFIKAFKLYTEVLETLIPVADVHFVFCPSNHDYTNGFFLCQAVEQFFRLNNNITFDCSIAHRKYAVYGENLIGFTHGDGGSQANLPLTMAHEAKEWSQCKHRYIFCHHVHHKTAKDYMGVAVESMRSPSGTDSWHHRNQFANNIKAVEGFIHHPNFGQIARLNHIF